jgi:hypothetical protein
MRVRSRVYLPGRADPDVRRSSRQSVRPRIDETERRRWFLFETRRHGDKTGH